MQINKAQNVKKYHFARKMRKKKGGKKQNSPAGGQGNY